MKGKYCLIGFVLLVSIIGVLALTASEYVDCRDFNSDEFLDLALASEYTILPIFDPHLNTHSILISPLKIFYFQRSISFSAVLRF
jgi:hypothetical protein